MHVSLYYDRGIQLHLRIRLPLCNTSKTGLGFRVKFGVEGSRLYVMFRFVWRERDCFYAPFVSILVILGQWNDENERMCAKRPCIWSEKILPSAGFQPGPLL